MEPMVNVALRAAWEAENLVNRMIDRPDLLKVTRGKTRKYVTNLEGNVGDALVKTLRQAYPQHAFHLPEEGIPPETASVAEFVWLIDPLSGTENLLRGLPHFAFTLVCLNRGRPEHALIVDPIRRERFTASRGKGAQLNDSRIRVTGRTTLKEAALAMHLGTSDDLTLLSRQTHVVNRMRGDAALVRESGCPALDLAYIAAGRLDAGWLTGVGAEALVAGSLLVTEAGGLVSDFAGGQAWRERGQMVAASPKCLKPLLQLAHEKAAQ